MNFKVSFKLKLQIKILSYFILVNLGFTQIIWARDILYINRSRLNAFNNSWQEIGFGLPPVGNTQFMWNNGFALKEWQDEQINYSQIKWSPSLIYRLNDTQTFAMINPHSWSSDTHADQFASTALTKILIINIIDKSYESVGWNWSYGVMAFDESNKHKIYPIAGFSYNPLDSLWKFNVGYPNVSILYKGFAPDEFLIFFSRESAKVFLKNNVSNLPETQYLDENLNIIGVSYRMNIKNIYRLNFRYGYSFSSQYQYLNKNYDAIADYKDYSKQSLVSLVLSVDLSGLKK